jgi:hypothetical protein
MEPATYTLCIITSLTGFEVAAVLTRVNASPPPVTVAWSDHGNVLTFEAETWLPILKGRVADAFEAELGADWRETLDEAKGLAEPDPAG